MSTPSNKQADGTTSFRDVRMRGFRDRTNVTQAQQVVEREANRGDGETVSSQETANRVLVTGICSEIAIPPFERAAMDGYALRGEETFGASDYNALEFDVIGVSLPGKPFGEEVRAGQAVRIMTGAPVPNGADAVVRVEATEERANSRVGVKEPVSPGRHVGKIGEDISVGTEVLPKGRVLRPQDLGVLASIGVAQVEVVRRPTVAILVTGDELLPAGAKPAGYQIVDSNSVILRALVQRDGGIVEAVEYVPDQRDAVRRAIQTASSDVVLISGGSSVGQEDHAPGLVSELGEVLFHGVALRPASPTGFGILNEPRRLVFLMPGNPVSCLCAYDLFAGRAVRRLGGRKADPIYPRVQYRLAKKISSVVGRVDYVRVRLENGRVEPLATSGASILSSTTRADGFVLIDHDSEGLPEGAEVVVHLYDF